MLGRSSNGFHFHSMFTCLHSLNKSLILYSTSVASKNAISNPLMIEFLVKSVGFTEEEAVSVVNKVSYPLKSVKKSELVVDFLKESGFDGTQIRNVVARFPDVLRNKVDKTLKPKIRAFEDLGFSGSNLGSIISQHPYSLGESLEHGIVPVIGMLKSILGSNEKLVSFLLRNKSQRLFTTYQVCKIVPANMLLLRSYGLTSERIKWLLLHTDFLFGSTLWAEKLVKRVEEKLGIPRTSNMFMYGIRALTMKSEENVNSMLDVFRSYGWSETDISTLLKKHPIILSLSEEHVRSKLKYFMEDLGLGSDYLAVRPVLLSLSMEKRIVPRVAVRQTLMDRNLLKHRINFHSFMTMPEPEFRRRFVLHYMEKLPQLYEKYTLVIDSTKEKH